MSTASRDSGEPLFRDSTRGVTRSESFLEGTVRRWFLDRFRPQGGVTPYILCVWIGLLIGALGSNPFTCMSWDLSIYRLQIFIWYYSNCVNAPIRIVGAVFQLVGLAMTCLERASGYPEVPEDIS